LARKYADKGLVVVAPSLDAEGVVKKFRERHGVDYPMLTVAGTTARAYGIMGYPTLVLVGKDNKVKWVGHGETADFIRKLEAELEK
jgi:peroxiredoxin